MTVDVLADGSSRPGGTAFYAALQASRLGLRALILTRGVPEEIERLLAPYRGELSLRVQPAEHTTTLHTLGEGAGRRQRVLAWAGPIELDSELDTAIVHLAPVARETPSGFGGAADFIGLTPQGLARVWSGEAGEIELEPPDPEVLPVRCDAVVISEVERDSCAELVARAARGGAVVAVTAGHKPTTILAPGAASQRVPTPGAEGHGEDLGAGDVFAAAFFIALRDGQPAAGAAAFAGAAAALRLGAPGTSGIAGRSAIEARVSAGAGSRA